jgi:broad specificity phosphatase PhoE
MGTEIAFLRHAQSVGNLTDDYDRSDYNELSEGGHEQARRLVDPLVAFDPDRIVVSPTVRTRGTIRPTLRETGRRAAVWPELSEACWHPTHDDDPSATPQPGEPVDLAVEEVECLDVTTAEFPACHPGDESYAEGLARLRLARDRIEGVVSEDGETTLLVVGHAHANGRLIELLLGMEPLGRFGFDNASLSTVIEPVPGVPDRRLAYSNRQLAAVPDDESTRRCESGPE